MKLFQNFFCFLIVAAIPTFAQASEVHGRGDLCFFGLILEHLAHNKVVNKSYLYGSRADFTIVPFAGYGVALKTMGMYATGDGDFVQGGLEIAHYTPLSDCFAVMPGVGYTYSDMRSSIKLPSEQTSETIKFDHTIRSHVVFCAFDVYYTINEKWMLTGAFQYGWASSHGKVHYLRELVESGTQSSSGPSFAGIIDYYFTKCWSLSAAVGYNRTLTKERHGVRGMGYKLGMGYTF